MTKCATQYTKRGVSRLSSNITYRNTQVCERMNKKWMVNEHLYRVWRRHRDVTFSCKLLLLLIVCLHWNRTLTSRSVTSRRHVTHTGGTARANARARERNCWCAEMTWRHSRYTSLRQSLMVLSFSSAADAMMFSFGWHAQHRTTSKNTWTMKWLVFLKYILWSA